MRKVIINACGDLGVQVNGTSLGPKKICEEITLENIINVECENIEKSTDKNDLAKNFVPLNEFNERVYNVIAQNEDFIITLGGDHSIAIASALASVKKHGDLGIIWIDAHPDYNTFETTITGNIHGLPLATITGVNGESLSKFHNGSFIDTKSACIVGARAIDPLEQKNLDDNNIKVFSTKDVQTKDINLIMDEAFKTAGDNKKIHISFDVDVIDPKLAPGVSVPEVNGISFEEAEKIFDYVLNHIDKVASIDIVEYNPLKDKDDVTLNFVTKLLKKLIKTLD